MQVPSIHAGPRHFPPLDGIRGIAIILVILVHTFLYRGASPVGRVVDTTARAGWTGVMLFFVLSGFLITGILLDTRGQRHALRDFYARRALRIFPLYFGFLAVYFFAVPHLTDRLAQPTPAEQPLYWCYLVNYHEALTGHGPTSELAPMWSLAVEEQVYLVWPLLITLTPWRHLPRLLIGLAVASLLWRLASRALVLPIEVTYAWSPSALEPFAAGGLVAWLARHRGGELLAKWSPQATLAAGCFVAGMFVAQRHFNFWEAPAKMLTLGVSGCVWLFAGIIGWSVTASDRVVGNRLLAASVLRSAGRYSYAIYLFHGPVIGLLHPLIYSDVTGWVHGLSLTGAFAMTITVFAVSWAAAWVSWRTWESPWLSLKRFFPTTGRSPHSPVC